MSRDSVSASPFRRFPRTFWVANVMEIFERMGWYGFYAISTVYLTGSVAEGGLGFSSRDRGVIQGVSTFFLYFLPALFGTLADRYGYRLMFALSAVVMVPGYLLLQLPRSFAMFFLVYLLVACGHGMFKPVVLSTVVRSTDKDSGTLGFGIFYMMVNIGGFLGPIVGGVVRGWSWNYVFYASAIWTGLMGLLALIFYREPPAKQERELEPLGIVLERMVALVGSGRFFALLLGVLLALVLGSRWWSFTQAAGVAAGWIALHLLWDVALRAFRVHIARLPGRPAWYLHPLRVGEGKYLIFLLLMSGFWTCFNQLAMTLPEYIRDYVDSSDLVRALAPVASAVTAQFRLLGIDTASWSKAVLDHGQIKPEHLINLNSLGIIFLQVFISYLARGLPPLVTIISGVLLSGASFLLYIPAGHRGTGWLVAGTVLMFSVGEMLASPKSKEYAGRIAPPDKVGMYMGYFYLSVALGNLFGGLLSGAAYQSLGKHGADRPDLLFGLIAALSVLTAVALLVYDRWVMRSDGAR